MQHNVLKGLAANALWLESGPLTEEDSVAAGIDANLDIWMGMPHGFITNIGGFNSATGRSRQAEHF
jgi:hypothetical protein